MEKFHRKAKIETSTTESSYFPSKTVFQFDTKFLTNGKFGNIIIIFVPTVAKYVGLWCDHRKGMAHAIVFINGRDYHVNTLQGRQQSAAFFTCHENVFFVASSHLFIVINNNNQKRTQRLGSFQVLDMSNMKWLKKATSTNHFIGFHFIQCIQFLNLFKNESISI